MSSKLNPDAKEFIPFGIDKKLRNNIVSRSPNMTFGANSGRSNNSNSRNLGKSNDIIAQSPKKDGNLMNMDAFNVPNENEFQEEIYYRPNGSIIDGEQIINDEIYKMGIDTEQAIIDMNEEDNEQIYESSADYLTDDMMYYENAARVEYMNNINDMMSTISAGVKNFSSYDCYGDVGVSQDERNEIEKLNEKNLVDNCKTSIESDENNDVSQGNKTEIVCNSTKEMNEKIVDTITENTAAKSMRDDKNLKNEKQVKFMERKNIENILRFSPINIPPIRTPFTISTKVRTVTTPANTKYSTGNVNEILIRRPSSAKMNKEQRTQTPGRQRAVTPGRNWIVNRTNVVATPKSSLTSAPLKNTPRNLTTTPSGSGNGAIAKSSGNGKNASTTKSTIIIPRETHTSHLRKLKAHSNSSNAANNTLMKVLPKTTK